MSESFNYIGSELEVFSNAINWKSYFSTIIKPYLGKNVLEVGAGIGATTKLFVTDNIDSWLCLEPDKQLSKEIYNKISSKDLPGYCEVASGTIASLPNEEKYNSILYIDVLEHIEDDKSEVLHAVQRLESGGSLIILSPAHNYLYTSFDKEIGHYRRYTKDSLNKTIPDGMKVKKLIYLDCVGFSLSLLNKLIQVSHPNKSQILFWDRNIIPVSKKIDKLLKYSFGKTVLGIWEKS